MRRSITLVMTLLFAGAAFAQPAYAQAPEPVDVRFVDRHSCDFPVSVHFVGKISSKVFRRDNGHFDYKVLETSPGLKVTFKNLETGKTLRHSVAGVGIFKFERRGPFSFSRAGSSVSPFNPVTDRGGLWATRGRLHIVIDEDWDVSSRFTGHLVNVCKALA